MTDIQVIDAWTCEIRELAVCDVIEQYKDIRREIDSIKIAAEIDSREHRE
jgi:hypothetical protein